MSEVIINVISRIESKVPELKGKIQAGAVDEETKVPYAAYTIPQETPVRTFHGIAGFETTFDIAVFHTRQSEVETIKLNVIRSLERFALGGMLVRYKTGVYDYYSDFNMHGYTLTFKILNYGK